jgi:elongation factor 1-alpha
MVSDADNTPCKVAKTFVGQVIQLHSAIDLAVGKQVSVEICTACANCQVVELLQKIDRRSGKILEERAEFLKAGEVAFCKFEPQSAMVIEATTDFAMLGRFCIRQDGHVVAVGMVKSVEYE